MEPLGALASVVALLQGTIASIRYIHDVKDAGQDHLKLAHEMSALSLSLQDMCDRLAGAQSEDYWLQGCWALATPGGVFSQIHDIIKEIESKVSPESGAKRFNQKLKWPFTKPDIQKKLADIERLKSQIDIVLHQDHMQLSKQIFKATKDTWSLVDLAQNAKQFDEIIGWLSPLKFQEQQQYIHRQAIDTTGKWLLQSYEFEEWISGHVKILYCAGMPGVGKTFLSSIIIDHLQKQTNRTETPVLFLYLNHKDTLEQTLENLVGGLVRQLLQLRAPMIPEEIKKLWEDCSRGETRPKIDQLMKNLGSLLEAFNKNYIVVDALDECLDEITRHKLLQLLHNLQEKNVFLLVTSRPIPNVFISDEVYCNGCGASGKSHFYHCDICNHGDYDLCEDCTNKGATCLSGDHTFLNVYTCQQIDIKAADEDLRLYLEEKLKTEPRLVSVCKKDVKMKERIICRVMDVADGVFLLAKLLIDALKTKATPKAVTKALENPPETLDQLYDDTLKRIEKQGEDDFMYAKKIFMWVTWSKRALSKEELLHALAVSQEDDDLDAAEILDESYIFSVTAGLLSVDYRGQVRLVHKTTDSFLKKNKERWFNEAEHKITMTTLTYLNFESFAEPCKSINEDELLEQRLTSYPFLVYASEHWGEHAREQYNTNPDIRKAVLKFVRSPLRLAAAIQAAWYTGCGWNVRKGVNSLHVCAWFGLEDLITDILSEGVMVDSQDPVYEQTPLMYACKRGHTGAVKILLQHGAAVNIRSARESTALFEAVEELQNNVVEELIKVEALAVNAKHPLRYSMNALQMAIVYNSVDITELLLTRPDIRVNEKDSTGQTALMLAASQDDPGYIRALIRHPDTDVNYVGSDDQRTALTVAAANGFTENVTALLEGKADPSLRDIFGGVPILRAIDNGWIETVKAMAKLGVDINLLDNFERSLLHGACVNGQYEIAEILIDAGLNINARGNRGETCLHDAAKTGHCNVVTLLLETGIDASIKDKEGRVALEVAIQNGNFDAASIIRNKTQSISSNESSDILTGMTVWGMARLGYFDNVKRYIQEGGDLNVKDPDMGESALHNAAFYGHPEILELLWNAKMDLNDANNYGRTALHCSALCGSTDCAKLLIDKNANLDLKDMLGKSALVTAQDEGFWEIVVLLIEANATIDKDLAPIQEPFFAAVRLGNLEAVKRLINEGADLQALEYSSGRTALQLAKEQDHTEIIQILRQHKSFYLPTRTITERSEDKILTLSQLGDRVSHKDVEPFKPRPKNST